MSLLFAPAARTMLGLLGWAPLNPSIAAAIRAAPRTVLVFSHTSYVDFYIMLLYRCGYGHLLPPIRVLVKPDPFRYANRLLRAVGALPAGALGVRGAGAMAIITGELAAETEWALLISPKGTIDRPAGDLTSPMAGWRSGFYVIARHFQAPLLVVGLDYETHAVAIGQAVTTSDDLDSTASAVRSQLGQIVPLFPADEVVAIRPHNHSARGVVSAEVEFCARVICVWAVLLWMGA